LAAYKVEFENFCFRFKNEAEAIAMANETDLGLAGEKLTCLETGYCICWIFI
jgi:hypothetical protein